MRFHIETYGCTANQGNSLELKSTLEAHGHLESDLHQADVIVLNTCVVTERTERKMLKRIHELSGRRLIVAGCLPAAIPELLSGVETVGVLNRENINRVVRALGSAECRVKQNALRSCLPVSLCGIVNISEGCLGACTYCIVKRARGGLISKSPSEIVDEVRLLLKSGAVEIQLASQDAGAYGYDIGVTLPDLLDRLASIPGRFMIRVGMMKPDSALNILDDLIDSFENDKIYKFLHLPVQSGSDRILDMMGRGYTAEMFFEIVERFRSKIPEISLTTDVIVGFPGETAEDHSMTMDLIRRVQPDKVNVTRYSRRPHTPASKMYDMPDRIKKERSRRITKLWMDIALNRNMRFIGRDIEVLVTERGYDGTLKARTEDYRGVVVEGDALMGERIKVKATRATPFYVVSSPI